MTITGVLAHRHLSGREILRPVWRSYSPPCSGVTCGDAGYVTSTMSYTYREYAITGREAIRSCVSRCATLPDDADARISAGSARISDGSARISRGSRVGAPG